MTVIRWAAIAVALFPTLLRAQSGASIREGERVRVSTSSFRHEAPGPVTIRVDGSFAGSLRDTLRVIPHPGSDTIRLAIGDITRLRVARGAHRPILHDGVVGLLWGAAIGAFLGAAGPHDPKLVSGAEPAIGAIVLGSMGAAGGLVVGSFERTRWITVDKERLH